MAASQCIGGDQGQQDNQQNTRAGLFCAICQNPQCLGILPGVCGRAGQNQQRIHEDVDLNRLFWKLMPINDER